MKQKTKNQQVYILKYNNSKMRMKH